MHSRERLLAAWRGQPPDHTPCAFMIFGALRGRCQDPYEEVLRQLEMGLDAFLFVPTATRGERRWSPDLYGLHARHADTARVDLWEQDGVQGLPELHKVYHTPAGDLSTAVRLTADWPHGALLPFVDDYQIPRALKPLITGPGDLAALSYLLQPPTSAELARLAAEMETAHAFSAAQYVPLVGGWGVAADMVGWLCGLEQMATLAFDAPAFLRELLALIGAWNRARMTAVLHEGVDLYVRRGWYESTDFWSPRLYTEYILPGLRAEAELAHAHGALFGYIMTSGTLPLLDVIRSAGVDVLIGADPFQRGERPLAQMRARLDGRVCIWGGVNGALTVEQGEPEEVARAVVEALETMRGASGFVLSPIDNVRVVTQRAWRNVDVLIRTWQERR